MLRTTVEPEKVLKNDFDREDLMFYVKQFLPRFLMLFFTPFIFLVVGPYIGWGTLKLILVFGACMFMNMALFLGCMLYLFFKAKRLREIFNTNVKKYGYSVLAQEVNNRDNYVFMLFPHKYETYVILTQNFLIISKEFIIRRNEISNLRIDMASARGDTVRPYNPSIGNVRETTRFARDIYITDINGFTHKKLVAFDDVEMAEFRKVLTFELGPAICTA
jgi:hypothetical protein